MPNVLQGRKFYQPGALGYEGKMAAAIEKRRELQLATLFEGVENVGQNDWSNIPSQVKGENGESWKKRAEGEQTTFLEIVQKNILKALDIKPDEMVLDLHFGSGLFTWEFARLVQHQSVYTVLHNKDESQMFENISQNKSHIDHIITIQKKSNKLGDLFTDSDLKGIHFDKILAFKSFMKWEREGFQDVLLSLVKKGKIVIFEYIPSKVQRPLDYLTKIKLPEDTRLKWKNAEKQIFSDAKDTQLNWSEKTIIDLFSNNPHCQCQVELIPQYEPILFNKNIFERLFGKKEMGKPSYGERMCKYLGENEYSELKKLFETNLLGTKTTWLSTYALITVEVN